jgi:hypothetical protein
LAQGVYHSNPLNCGAAILKRQLPALALHS